RTTGRSVRPAGVDHHQVLGIPIYELQFTRHKSMSLNVLAVVGSLQSASVSRVVIRYVAERLAESGCSVDLLDFHKERLALYDPDVAHQLPGFLELQRRVAQADVIVLGTPDYHGSISGSMKNFLDHFWRE